MQALHFSFGFGGIISPLVLEPFLAEKICVPIMHHNQTGRLCVALPCSLCWNRLILRSDHRTGVTTQTIVTGVQWSSLHVYRERLCVLLQDTSWFKFSSVT